MLSLLERQLFGVGKQNLWKPPSRQWLAWHLQLMLPTLIKLIAFVAPSLLVNIVTKIHQKKVFLIFNKNGFLLAV